MFTYKLIIYILLGFAAELIDGSLGMAYGVSSNSFLRAAGVPSAFASASVHIAEMFTTLVSGISHIKMRNVSKKLFLRLLIPGIIGGALGAYLLSEFSSSVIDIVIDVYLIVMGVIILLKVRKKQSKKREFGTAVIPLGFVGGLTDAMGGGGWGPVVTSTLIATDHDVRRTIGSVNTAEFFVTIAETTTFVTMLGDFRAYTEIIVGLIVGGIIAAPLGAYLCKKVPVKPMLAVVGVLIIVLNVYKLINHIM